MEKLFYYTTVPEIEAFSTMKGAVLPYPVIQPHQTHQDKIVVVDNPNLTREDLEGVDALVTTLEGVAIGVRSADCVPVLLYDPVHRVVAAVHSGWRGTVQWIVAKTLRLLEKQFGTSTRDVQAMIGPCICNDCFQVGPEVVQAFREALFPEFIFSYREPGSVDEPMKEGHHIDLVEANAWLLTSHGVLPENITRSGVCTYKDERFPSARREKNVKCERIINAIRLNKS
jgi:hypothetical protein